MSNYYTLENPIIWDWDVSREMPNINNFKPRTTTLWDPSLPMETIPPIHIFTYYEEETGRIKISKDWWKHYLAEYYTEFQLREHVSNNLPKNTYAPLNQIYNMAWIHQYTIHMNLPKNDSEFVRDGVWSNHFMLSNDGRLNVVIQNYLFIYIIQRFVVFVRHQNYFHVKNITIKYKVERYNTTQIRKQNSQ